MNTDYEHYDSEVRVWPTATDTMPADITETTPLVQRPPCAPKYPDILISTSPEAWEGRRIMMFEYLPRFGWSEIWAYEIWDNENKLEGRILMKLRSPNASVPDKVRAILQFVAAVGYYLGNRLVGWKHVQLVVVEKIGEDFRGIIFGGTKYEEEESSGEDAHAEADERGNENAHVEQSPAQEMLDSSRNELHGFKLNVPHSQHGKTWVYQTGSEYEYAGCTDMTDTEILGQGTTILRAWKRRGIRYGLTRSNCEAFSHELAGTILSETSRLQFAAQRQGAADFGPNQRRYSDDNLGRVYYSSRTDERHRRFWYPLGYINHRFPIILLPAITVVIFGIWTWATGMSLDEIAHRYFGKALVFFLAAYLFGSALMFIELHFSYHPWGGLSQRERAQWQALRAEHRWMRTPLAHYEADPKFTWPVVVLCLTAALTLVILGLKPELIFDID